MVLQVHSLGELQTQLKGAGDKLVLVDFFAEWCGPCKMIAPAIVKMAEQFPNVVFLKVDVDDAQDASEEYGISAMPTFIFFKGGQKVETIMGANEQKIRDTVAKLAH